MNLGKVYRLGAAIRLIFVSASLVLGCSGCTVLRSEPDVTIDGVQPGTRFICLISDDGGSQKAMWWRCGSGTILTCTMHPGDCTHSWLYNDEQYGGTIHRVVVWERGDRVGLVWQEGSACKVAWFGGEKAHREGYIPLLASGTWHHSLADADSIEHLSEEYVVRLGLTKPQ